MELDKIFEFVRKNFGSSPEYLWKKSPDTAILRNKKNKKWYAIIMKIPRKKLGINKTGNTQIINLKLEPVMIASLLNNNHGKFFPAYHMNKEHWITIDLNSGKISDSEILNLIILSFEIINKK